MISKSNLAKLKAANTPSKLLRLAIDDMKAVVANPAYKIDMGTWHCMSHDKKCYVCLSGAVLANTVKLPRTKRFLPYSFSNFKTFNPIPHHAHLVKRIVALNEIRQGNLTAFCEKFSKAAGEKADTLWGYSRMAVMHPSPSNKRECKLFLKEMETLVDRLERAGL